MKKKIEWNKVTWYSKMLAAVIFVVLPLVSFYLGIKLGYFVGSSPAQVNVFVSRGMSEVMQKYTDFDLGFSVDYPTGWALDQSQSTDTILSLKPAGGTADVKIYLQKNSYKDIYALKSAVDKRVGTDANAILRQGKTYDALYYGKVNGSAVMYVPLTKDFILGIAGPDNSATWEIFNSFVRL